MVSPKNYRVDSFVTGLAIKAPCVVYTNAAITLSGEQTVNGVPVTEGDRVLVKDQADKIENGVYNVETSAWQRTGDFDGNRDVTNGTLVIVAIGTTVTIWECTGTNPIEIGTSELTFAQTI